MADERPPSNAEHPTSNNEFCHFRRSIAAISFFDIRYSIFCGLLLMSFHTIRGFPNGQTECPGLEGGLVRYEIWKWCSWQLLRSGLRILDARSFDPQYRN
jgi:hypothetical protein